LIELLIVVAIIAILAAIAVPNFLEAQTRAKVARAVADMRTLAIALESYATDYNHYPPEHNGTSFGDPDSSNTLFRITSPIAYITSIEDMEDPFQTNVQQGNLAYGPLWKVDMKHYFYVEYETWAKLARAINRPVRAFGMSSLGPDHNDTGILWGLPVDVSEPTIGDFMTFAFSPTHPDARSPIYDATNGTNSPGDLARFGGMVPSRTNKYLNGYSGTR
jgi:general secretion pathway protein G